VTDSRDDWERHWQDYHETAEENPAQNYRRSMVLSLLGIQGTGRQARIMDIGSGQGDMAASVLKEFPEAEVMGLELSKSGVEISSRKVPQARFVQRNLLEKVEPPKEQKNWATHAICTEVLEHLEDPALLLTNARQYMAEGCRLVITVPGGPMSAFDKHIGHRKHWRAQEIESLMRQTGFTPERVSGAGFPFFNLYRCIVILRGKKLISDVSAGPAGSSSLSARIAMNVFHGLIRRNLNSSRTGWQIIGTAIAARPKSAA
jgi:2-polyprenyl-3-methyl-5-hydroxy-6-metoxy-1,4-benzoquinol methylase